MLMPENHSTITCKKGAKILPTFSCIVSNLFLLLKKNKNKNNTMKYGIEKRYFLLKKFQEKKAMS